MEVSAEMRNPAGQEWVSAVTETNELLGAVVSIMHPATFLTGIQCIKGIQESDDIAKRDNLNELLEVWTSPFIAGSIINNRSTPLHRDNGASYSAMDTLTSVGPFQYGRFMVPTLGYQFLFGTGSLFGILGRIVPHAAEASGERFCLAQYLRENILSTLGVEEPEWQPFQACI